MNYYNENDPKSAAWLRELIVCGHIPMGVVDERSIEDIKPADLAGYTQCHFFAGIGGWSLALKLAGWPNSRSVWTGSCPCQPFSAAGKGTGFADERHLWPTWFHLISQCQPAIVFGEQVEAAIKHGWLDLVQDDLEACGYAFGAAVLPAASVGASHIRSRGWFVAERLADSTFGRSGTGLCDREQIGQRGDELADNCATDRLDNSPGQGPQKHSASGPCAGGGIGRSGEINRPDPFNLHWSNPDWLFCRDGKWRPVEPGTQPLAHGVPARVGRLRGYGNAVVPQVAAEFIRSVMYET